MVLTQNFRREPENDDLQNESPFPGCLHLIGIQSQLPAAVELLHGRLHRLRCFKTSMNHWPCWRGSQNACPAFRASSKVTEVFSILFTIAFFTLGKHYWITTDIALSSFQPKPGKVEVSGPICPSNLFNLSWSNSRRARVSLCPSKSDRFCPCIFKGSFECSEETSELRNFTMQSRKKRRVQ